MRIGLVAGQFGPDITVDFDLILEAERLGYSSVWTAEAYGNDAIVPLAFIAARTTKIGLGTAIMQMPGRTPALAAMTAMTLDKLSGGRFHLGLGPSGPQVVEGWHGVPYGRPLTRTREYVSIIRKILAREAPLEHKGFHYQIPYTGPDSTGLGKPLKSILHGRADMKIYTAAISPKGLECSGEIADGVLPVWMNPERSDLIEDHVKAGIAKTEGKSRRAFDVAPFVTAVVGADIEKCRMPVKGMLALYIGGMGAKGRNFYNDLTVRYGFEEAAETVQDRYLSGDKAGAAAAIPDELIDEVALIGPKERIAERLERWTSSSVSTIAVAAMDPQAYQVMAELVL